MSEWEAMTERIRNSDKEVKIALVGKYVQLHDAYLSVAEALRHGGWENGANVNIEWIDSEGVNSDTVEKLLGSCDGLLVPGGFGDRGIEGKITAIRYAREHDMPFSGICLGMQMAVVEFARNVLELKSANSSEFAPEGQTPGYPLDAGSARRYSDGRNYETGRISLRSDAGYEAGGSLRSGRSGGKTQTQIRIQQFLQRKVYGSRHGILRSVPGRKTGGSCRASG